jgi:polar amino acid transport system substrate-binding protein
MRLLFRHFCRPQRGPIVAAALFACVSAVLAQTPTLRLVSTAWSPFTNDAGRPRLALDLVEAALGRVGVSTRTEMVSPVEFTPALLSSRFDGSAAAWKDAEREKALIFSLPYLENRLILVGRRGSDVSASTLAALKGSRVAIVEGYAYGEAIDNAGPVFVRTPTDEESLARLLKGAVDYTVMDELVVRYIASNYPKEAQSRLAFGTTPVLTRPLFFALRRDFPNAESIVARFNAEIRAMITDRTYHRILHLDWINADIDGDGVAELVAGSERVGTIAPTSAYSLSTSVQNRTLPDQPGGTPGFYVGGTIYSDWASVPNRYKVEDPRNPDPKRSTASIFTFRW